VVVCVWGGGGGRDLFPLGLTENTEILPSGR
jgi:hypothetical protein